MKTIGTRIRELRDERGWSCNKAAVECGLSQSMLWFYESGKVLPSLMSAIAIADTYNITLDDLVGRDNIAMEE